MEQIARDELLRDFCYHQVSADTQYTMAAVRIEYYNLANTLLDWLPESRERSLALTHLEDSLMRAIQCLAIHMPGATRIIPHGEGG